MPHVTYQEKAFLQLVARRVLRFRREAETRGEVYHDLTALAPLQCGAFAQYRFDAIPGGYAPVVQLRNVKTLPLSELKKIAEEILEGPVKLRQSKDNDLEYVREMDAGVLAPE